MRPAVLSRLAKFKFIRLCDVVLIQVGSTTEDICSIESEHTGVLQLRRLNTIVIIL